MALHLSAPAKVNLFLEVLGRRPDGYHEIRTCFHAIDLTDELVLEVGGGTGDGVELDIRAEATTGLPVAAGPDNLICRAAAAFRQAAGIRDRLRFTVEKRIPAGAGLGGGSSDAAAALRLLEVAFGEPLGPPRLHELAATLGADVPFFLAGGTQIGTGIGDRLTPIDDAPELHFVLVLPPFGTSTADVYRRLRAKPLPVGPLNQGAEFPRMPAHEADWRGDLAVPERFRNDLEAAAMEAEPRLAGVRARVIECGYRAVRMSGSGSTLFVAFREAEEAASARAALGRLRDEGVVVLSAGSDSCRVRRPAEVPPPEPRSERGVEAPRPSGHGRSAS